MEVTYHDCKITAREKLHGNWKLAIAVTFFAALLGGMLSGSSVSLQFGLDNDDLQTLSQILPYDLMQLLLGYLTAVAPFAFALGLAQFIIGGVIRLGYCRFLLKLYDGEDAQLNDLFSQFHRFGDGFCLALLQGIFVALWTLLFIIPGIIAAIRYSMAPFILYENPGMTASEAIDASKEMMEGHKMDYFVLGLTFIGWGILCAFTLGIGDLWLNPYMNMTDAAFYRMISPKKHIFKAIPE